MSFGDAVRIMERVLVAIDEHARAEAPRECCGLLRARNGLIEGSRRARNLASSQSRYEIEPEDHFAAIREARSLGGEVIGAYHSHPRSAPVPSPTDREQAFAGFLYVIASPKPAGGSDVRAFTLEQDGFREIALVRVSDD
jgi:proteasome lid subunit RPN8/RPN11